MKIAKCPTVIGVLFMLIGSVFFSCGSKPDLSSHIPKDANVVMAIDIQSMALKSLDFKEILTLENIKKAFGSMVETDTAGNPLKDSGLDLMSKAYFFMNTDEAAGYGALAAVLSDSKKFEDFLRKYNKDLAVTQEGDFKVAAVTEEKGMAAWNDNMVLLFFAGDQNKEKLLSFANLKKEESLAASTESFKQLEKEAADISLWVSFEPFEKLIPQYNPTGTSLNLKETFLTATCNFENGKVVINSKYAMNEETGNKLSFIKSNVSADIASTLPGKELVGMMGFALDMNKVYDYLEQEKVLEPYDASATQMTGMPLKDVFGIFSGDVVVTVNGFAMKEVQSFDWNTGQVITKKEPTPDYYVAVGITNMEKMGQLLGQFSDGGMLKKVDNYYSMQDKVFMIPKGSALVITGSEQLKQFALDGNGEKLNADLSGMLTTNASSVYLNFGNISEDVYAQESMKGLKDSEIELISVTGTAIANKECTGKVIVQFRKKDENSLITLTRISKKYAEQQNEISTQTSVAGEPEILP